MIKEIKMSKIEITFRIILAIIVFFIPLAIWVIITIFVDAFGISSSIKNVENKQNLNIVQTTSILICPLH